MDAGSSKTHGPRHITDKSDHVTRFPAPCSKQLKCALCPCRYFLDFGRHGVDGRKRRQSADPDRRFGGLCVRYPLKAERSQNAGKSCAENQTSPHFEYFLTASPVVTARLPVRSDCQAGRRGNPGLGKNQLCLRLRRRILPVAVLGISSIISTIRGHL